MATRPGNGQQTAPQQGTRLAAATLVIAISGLLLGVLFPRYSCSASLPLPWGPGTWGGARSSSARPAVV
jgi:hypothetical protein